MKIVRSWNKKPGLGKQQKSSGYISYSYTWTRWSINIFDRRKSPRDWSTRINSSGDVLAEAFISLTLVTLTCLMTFGEMPELLNDFNVSRRPGSP
ncbi:hypothetical protein TSAR_003731 [Trichomalopsis sarcophagae]|uniref:Uncharacterized protein n=1 Tax=Trichomalopsis sarcophagae TaxID=543379 RepID=A0A232EQ84_9HYME|nr:hypothetical protein TSAR_003731 [Trichomalopsis sarcophagae]